MRKLLTSLLVLSFIGCAGLSQLNRQRLQEGTRLNHLTYDELDGGAARAYARGAFCATSSVLRDFDAAIPEPDGGIQCQP